MLFPYSSACGSKLWGNRVGLNSLPVLPHSVSLFFSLSCYTSSFLFLSLPLTHSFSLTPRGEKSHYISVGTVGSESRAPEMPSWQCLLSDPSMLADLALTAPHASARQPGAVDSLLCFSSCTLAPAPRQCSLTFVLLPCCGRITLAQGWHIQSRAVVSCLQYPRVAPKSTLGSLSACCF